ncbi:hypothetical protein [Thalassospira sp.]|uniref:hypothetical protein n=1 Tax=Thalassospira sp. TaxID=1912094 RepID=UPI002734D67C|nr:hypothetical protein [Thalassospira sp.]MDP2699576.1 hypothetical protein [Thalassospira sp.]
MGLDRIIFGVLTILVAIGGLFYASGSVDGYSYFIGLIVFIAAVLFLFHLIKNFYDEQEKQNH